jgi:hypothetical protein
MATEHNQKVLKSKGDEEDHEEHSVVADVSKDVEFVCTQFSHIQKIENLEVDKDIEDEGVVHQFLGRGTQGVIPGKYKVSDGALHAFTELHFVVFAGLYFK